MPEKTARRLLNQSQYAQHRRERDLPGQSQPAVRKAIETGRIRKAVTRKGRRYAIDPEVADAEWQTYTQANKRRESKPRELFDDADDDALELPPLAESNARDGLFKSKLREVSYLEKAGRLLDATEAAILTSRMVRTARDRVLGIAPRIGPILASITDPDECTARLEHELETALAAMSAEERSK